MAADVIFEGMLSPGIPEAVLLQAHVLQVLPVQLTTEQAQAVLDRVLNAFKKHRDLHLRSVAVGDRHQAQAALGPILDGVRAASEPRVLLPLLQAVQKLVPQLTTDQAQAALVPAFDHMRDVLRISPNVLQALAPTISMLPVQLTAEQMQLAFAGVLDKLLLVGPVNQEQRVGKAIEMLAPRLTADQAQTALRAILHAMFSRGLLGVELQGVSKETARRLGLPEPRGAVVRTVMDGSPAAIAGIVADDVILAFDGKAIDTAPMLARLIASERPGKEGVVTLWRRGERKNLTVALGENTVRLSDNMGGDFQAAAMAELADAVKALPVQLTAEQAQLVHSGMIKTLRQSDSSNTSHVMARFVEALASKLTDEARANLLELARSSLAAETNPLVATGWAKAIEALLSPLPASGYAEDIVEVLKFPTTTLKYRYAPELNDSKPASATEYLLGKIHVRFPEMRDLRSDDLQATLARIAKSYPKIDLTSPPVLPASLTR